MNESTEREVPLALMVQAPDEPGVLHALTRCSSTMRRT